MKVLHLPFTYYPDPPGGTEVYVAGLVRHLARLDVAGVVAAPSSTDEAGSYEFLGHRVYRFPVPPPEDIRGLYGEGSAVAAAAVRRVIDEERPDIVHMHAYTRGVSTLVAREARAAGVPLVFTYHTPTASCQRGTLLRYGRIPCDGRVLVTRCSACIAQQHGAGVTSWAFALIPPAIGRLVGRLKLSGRRWVALRLTELLQRRKRAFLELMSLTSAVVAVSDWVRHLLVRNGVPNGSILVSRQGTEASQLSAVARSRVPASPLRAVMLGRLDSAKGLDILLAALALVPSLSIQVDVYGVTQGSDDLPGTRLREMVDRDPRVRLRPPFPSEEASRVIEGYDVTVVPSQVLETGPLVVLESFAAGVPVIGSRLGGIAERVVHGIDGLLVEAGDPAAWAAALSRIVSEPDLLPTLASGIRAQRTVEEVAIEMRDLYRRLLASQLSVAGAVSTQPTAS